MSTFKNAYLAELGKITLAEGTLFHFRDVIMSDGTQARYYGTSGGGPEDPLLVYLDILQQENAPIAYRVRENHQKDGLIIWFNLNPELVAQEVAKVRQQKRGPAVQPPGTTTAPKVPPPPVTPPPPPVTPPPPPPPVTPPPATKTAPPVVPPPGTTTANKTTPPATTKSQGDDFPSTPPPAKTYGAGDADNYDPWLGYGSRDAMFRAKDQHFLNLERHKIARDFRVDQEFTFRFFFSEARQIVLETGKKLAPNDLADLSFQMAIDLTNRFVALKKNTDGSISVRPDEAK